MEILGLMAWPVLPDARLGYLAAVPYVLPLGKVFNQKKLYIRDFNEDFVRTSKMERIA